MIAPFVNVQFLGQFDVYDGVRVGEEERKREHVLSRVVSFTAPYLRGCCWR